ncbi:MAG: replication protein, partial [Lachnospiraceae bacterium]|nr:replication protein [Lachnospiraceae bacterium]
PAVWEQYIEKLSEYMASTGKRYQSHAATIRRWVGEDAKKAAPPSRNQDYSVKEDETV